MPAIIRAAAALLLALGAVTLQAQEYCPPNAACVQSSTFLTYDPGTARMDGYTVASTDYGTAWWYTLCAKFALLKFDGTPPSGYSVPVPSGAPVCQENTTIIYLGGSAAAEPGINFSAVGWASVDAVFEYGQVVYDCYIYCSGYWDDEYAYSTLLISQPPPTGSYPSSATVAPYPFLSQIPRREVKTDSKGSTDFEGTPMPNLILTYNGSQISPGSTVWIWNDANLAGAPRMPPVTATLTPNNFSQQVRWWVRFTHTGGDSVPRSINTPATSDPNTPAHKYTPANGSYSFLNDTATIAGGAATLYWKIGNAAEQQAALNVHGTHPSRNDVKNRLGTSPWFIQQLAASETNVACSDGGMRQFCSSGSGAGRPIWGTPHGFGLMQIDPPPNYATLWDWTVNVDLGKQKINGTFVPSTTFWNSQVDQYNRYKAIHPNAKPPCPIIEGQCTFAFQEAGAIHSFRDAIWIKQYNGARPNYISWSDPQQEYQYWQASRYNSDGFNYVNRVCSQTVPNSP